MTDELMDELHSIMLQELDDLLPSFDDGEWMNRSQVTEEGLEIRIENEGLPGMTFCSKMYEHKWSIEEVMEQFAEYLKRMRQNR